MGKKFFKNMAERAVKTAAQAGIVAIGADITNALTLDWVGLFGAIVAGALVSVLTSFASLPVGPRGTPSLVEEN